MSKLLLIETSTALCSVALAEEDKIVAFRESNIDRSHASLTAVYVDEVLKERGIKIQDCDAVCVSEGPGSYTGLRVGVSTAKGLCFGAGVKLLSVNTLEVLFYQSLSTDNLKKSKDSTYLNENVRKFDYIVPMIDARRMEVYTCVFKKDGTQISEIEPKIIDENSYADLLLDSKVLFIGDGASKCEGVISNPNASFLQCYPKASSMLVPTLRELKEKRFKDIAYFEPFYLKEFVATVSKKKLF